MSNIIDITKKIDEKDKSPWFNFMLLCLACKHRWIGSLHPSTSVFTCECPRCHMMDSFGSQVTDEYINAVSSVMPYNGEIIDE